MQASTERHALLQKALPPEPLFAEKEWLLTPEPFPLTRQEVSALEKLGHRLLVFQRACNLLYRLSVKGKQPEWIAEILDAGKPKDLLEIACSKPLADRIPQVIRPDIILGEDSFSITELDSVPGGIGLTAWLNQTYTTLGFDVIGGESGMLDGFSQIAPDGADVLISDESATYRPEMEWLAGTLKQRGADWRVLHTSQAAEARSSVYRFFELFDLPNIPEVHPLLSRVASGAMTMSPPPKPWMEEKLWTAFFWLKPLQDFWRRELSERHWLELGKVFPMSWLMDPTPLPYHAVIPGLEIHSWEELGRLSQKERELVLKISGFSELAWGSRSVVIGQDVPQQEWAQQVKNAVASFAYSPYVLQRFHKGKIVEHPYYDPATGELRTMRGRVRLCPYYFVEDGKARLRGVLATICPADKKILHGMRDAIICPAAIKGD
jgi:hypothetical protein